MGGGQGGASLIPSLAQSLHVLYVSKSPCDVVCEVPACQACLPRSSSNKKALCLQLEKKRRQAEAAAKAKSAADEAQRVMDLFRSKEGSMAPSEAATEGGGAEGTPAGSHPQASSKKPEGSTPEGAFPAGP